MSNSVKAIYVKGVHPLKPGEYAASAKDNGMVYIGFPGVQVDGEVLVDYNQRTVAIDFGNYCEVWDLATDIQVVLKGLEGMVSRVLQSKVIFNQVIGKPENRGDTHRFQSLVDEYNKRRDRDASSWMFNA